MTATACKRRNLTVWSTCPCPDCRESVRRMKKMNQAGLYHRATPEEALKVLDWMVGRRWSSIAIASATGIKPSSAQHMISRQREGLIQQFGAGTCKALLDHGQPTAGSIGSTGARRRLQALAYIGYSLQDVAQATGIPYTTVGSVREGRTEIIRVPSHRLIDAAYRRMLQKPGPSRLASRHARAMGWVSALAWDDDTIDDPDAKPQGISFRNERAVLDDAAIERRIAGDRTVRLHKGETAEVVRRLIAAGTSSRTIHRDYGIKAERYIKVSELERAA